MSYQEFDAKADEYLPLRDVVFKKLRMLRARSESYRAEIKETGNGTGRTGGTSFPRGSEILHLQQPDSNAGRRREKYDAGRGKLRRRIVWHIVHVLTAMTCGMVMASQ